MSSRHFVTCSSLVVVGFELIPCWKSPALEILFRTLQSACARAGRRSIFDL